MLPLPGGAGFLEMMRIITIKKNKSLNFKNPTAMGSSRFHKLVISPCFAGGERPPTVGGGGGGPTSTARREGRTTCGNALGCVLPTQGTTAEVISANLKSNGD